MFELLIFSGILILIISIVLLWYLNNTSITNLLNQEMTNLKYDIYKGSRNKITEDDIKDFPSLIQRYFEFCGLIGQDNVINFKMSVHGHLRLNNEQPWLKIDVTQFNYIPKPTRLFFIKARFLGIMSMAGKDIYVDGKGNMQGKLMRVKTIFDERGKEFDIGEFTTFLNDLIICCPTGLITLKDRLKWTEIDDKSVEVSLTDENQIVTARLFFGKNGELVNFTSTDRFYEEKDEQGNTKYVQGMWSTPIDSYQEIGEIKLPHRARAIWHKESGEFCYAKFILDNIEYNISN